MDLSSLEQWRENSRLEVKAAQGGLPGDVWSSVSAFANTNGGLIVLEVKEDMKTRELFVVGLKDPQKMLDDFTNAQCKSGPIRFQTEPQKSSQTRMSS